MAIEDKLELPFNLEEIPDIVDKVFEYAGKFTDYHPSYSNALATLLNSLHEGEKSRLTAIIKADLEGAPLHKGVFHIHIIRSAPSEKYSNASGVALRSISKDTGQTRFMGKRYNFGRNFNNNGQNPYVVAVYDKGKVYFFDLQGNPVNTSLPYQEAQETTALLKRLTIKKKFEEIDLERWLDSSENALLMGWEQEEIACGKNGLSLIVEGELKRKVTINGSVYFSHYRNGKKRNSLFVGAQYAGEEATIKFRGQYALIFCEGSLVNAADLCPLGCIHQHNYDPEGKIVSIREYTTGQYPIRVESGDWIYVFSWSELKSKFGDPSKYNRIGLLIERDRDDSKFWLITVPRRNSLSSMVIPSKRIPKARWYKKRH